jgi:hypothetical protein
MERRSDFCVFYVFFVALVLLGTGLWTLDSGRWALARKGPRRRD